MTETLDRVPVQIDPSFVVDLKGRKFPMYAGVLDMATRSGLKTLTTTILQIPTAENGGMAIVSAIATFEDGRVFEDIGDASPASVKPLMIPAVLRMASTRAKGRALRDAMNVGQALLEELADEDAIPPPPRNGRPQAPNAPESPQKGVPAQSAKVGRAAIEARYLEYLERAANLGAVHTHAREFQVFRSFDPAGAMPEKLAEMCKGLKQFVSELETDAVEYQEARLDMELDAAVGAEA